MSGQAIDNATLPTARLILRQPATGDLADVLAMFSDPEVTRYWSGPPWTGLHQAEQWLARMRDGQAHGDSLTFVIEHRDQGRVIGTCTLFQIHHGCRRAEIGYALGRAWWGLGLMDEALRAMLAYAFQTLDLRRLEADIDPANRASARSLQRLGFMREGHLRERWEVAGEVTDSDVFGLLRREWAGTTAASDARSPSARIVSASRLSSADG